MRPINQRISRARGVALGLAVMLAAVGGAVWVSRHSTGPERMALPSTSPADGERLRPSNANDGVRSELEIGIHDLLGRFADPIAESEQAAGVAATMSLAIANRDWPTIESVFMACDATPDGEVAQMVRSHLRRLPPRHQPENLDLMTTLELVRLRSADGPGLSAISPAALTIRYVPAGASEGETFGRSPEDRRWFANATARGSFRTSAAFPFRIHALDEIEAAALAPRLYLSLGGFTADGDPIVLTMHFTYMEPHGWVPRRVSTQQSITPKTKQKFIPRV